MRATRPPIAMPVLLLLGGSLCLLLWLLFSLTLPDTGVSGDERPRTAGEAVRRAVCAPPGRDPGDEAAEFHEREAWPRASGSVVLFDARCAAGGGRPGPMFAGVATAQLLPDRSLEVLGVTVWEDHAIPSSAETGAGYGAPAEPSDFIAYDGYGVMEEGDGFASGRVIAHDRVDAVEAVLGDGRTLRGGVERGVWVLLAGGSGQMREVRAIGADGRVLQRIRLEQ